MKSILHISKGLTAAAGFLLLSAPVVSAGVVMSETATADGLLNNGVEHRTIYVQGHKQRVDSNGVQTITDLDKHLIYLIDTNQKNYVELPLDSLSGSLPDDHGAASDTLELKRTGGTHMVAAHSCQEYRGHEANAQLQITVSACVSTSAPGAQEIAKFDQAMLGQIEGTKTKIEPGSAGVVLEKKSELKLRAGGAAGPSTSLVTRTTVDNIKVTPLAAQTFAPPKGYSKVQVGPHDNVPENLQSAMLNRPVPRTAGQRPA
jgi:hypothetical protein